MSLNEKVNEIVKLVKEKDSLYKLKSEELIEELQNMERKKESSETQLIVLLLNFLLENYSLLGFNYHLISKETMKAIEKLLKELYESVLPDVYSIFDSIKTGKEKLNPLLLEACKDIYRQKQINFIRQFYKKIHIKNFKEFFPENEVDKIIAQEGWIKDKDYIIPTDKLAPPEFNIGKGIDDIKYINDINLQFNKLIKEHAHLVTFQNNSDNK
jgi:hypothetical protein